MADSISSALQLLLMGDGLHGSDWGAQTNANLAKVETAIAGQTSLVITGGSLTLTDDQARSAFLVFTGAPSSDQTILVPARPKSWVVCNFSTGSHNVIIQTTAGGPAITIRPGICRQVYTDGFGTVTIDDEPSQTGFVKMFAGFSVPVDYLLCDGRAVSRTTYASLYNTISTLYGVGDGSTTFNLPDMRGRVAAGPDNMGSGAAGRITSITNVLGGTGGEEVHTLTTTEIPNHNHTLHETAHNHGVTVGDPGHHHFVGVQIAAGAGGASPNPVNYGSGTGADQTSDDLTGITVTLAAATTGITIDAVGGGGAHNNLQPTLFLNFIIHI